MKIPKLNWISFDRGNLPELCWNEKYLVLLRKDHYDNGVTWAYYVDVAEPYGSYIDDFWDTENDWREGQHVEVIAYAEMPYRIKEEDLVEEV